MLGLLLLEPNCIRDLEQLVPTVAFESGHVVVLDDLHRDRRRALHRPVRREVRQGGPHQAAHVDTVVHPELVVLDSQKGIDHVVWHVGQLDRLAVLHLERGDFASGRVVHVRTLGEGGEVGQCDGCLGVGVGDPPHARGDGDHRGREQQRPGTDHQGQSEYPTQAQHSATDTTDGSQARGGRRLR